MAAYSMSYAIFTPLISAVVGGYDRRRIIAMALIVFVLGMVLTAVSSLLLPLVLAQVLTGMAAGQFAVTGQAVAVTLAPAELRARAISIVVGGTSFAVALGAPLGSFLAAYAGWRSGFIAIGVVAAACLVALWFTLPRHLPGAALSLGQRLSVVRRPGVARLIATTFAYLAGGFLTVAYIGPIAISGAGLSPDILPVALLIYGVGAISGNMISGRIADRVGPRRVVLVSIVTSIFGALSIYVVITVLPKSLAGGAMLALFFILGITGWTYPPAQTSRLIAAAPEAAHLSLALHASAIYLGIALGTFSGGRVLELATVPALGLASAGFTALALLMVLTERRDNNRIEPAGA